MAHPPTVPEDPLTVLLLPDPSMVPLVGEVGGRLEAGVLNRVA